MASTPPPSAGCCTVASRPASIRLYTWRREHPEPDKLVNPVERARVQDMEAEIRRLRMENEQLKLALAEATVQLRIWQRGAALADRIPSQTSKP